MTEFCMPSLGADMDEGKLVQWLVKVGDSVERGDLVAVVETSKAAVEVEIWSSGVVTELCVEPGETVPVGTVLARLDGDEGESASAASPEAKAQPTPKPALEPAAPAPAATTSASGGRKRASPAARRRARELGVDLVSVRGTGPGGAITVGDVEGAGGTAQAAPADDRAGAMRATIAAAMARSKREIPHYYLSQTVDVTEPLAWLQEFNAERKLAERVLPAALFVKAIAKAAASVAGLNGFWVDGGYRAGDGVHVAVAVALRAGGLVAPTLRGADRAPLSELMASFRDLVNRTRKGTLRSSELGGATITVTNLGDLGVEAVFGVITPPQVAIVGLGRVREEPRVVAGEVVPRSVITLSLSADHRASDGLQGAKFLAAIEKAIKAPEDL